MGCGSSRPDSNAEMERSKDLLARKHIKFKDLTFGKRLAAGHFGEVWRGTWSAQVCVIKQLKASGEEARNELIREAGQLAQLRPCPSVCTFYGVSLDGPLPCVVLEFIPGGELKKLLDDPTKRVTGHDIANMAMNLASGMEVLHAEGILHLDLAARNLLVTGADPLALRITDFGLSQTLPRDAEWIPVPRDTPIPTRWADPRVWTASRFTKGCDVFSFGVCMWEMSARTLPWAGRGNSDIVAALVAGDVLPFPSGPEKSDVSMIVLGELYSVMRKCWDQDEARRPSFEELRQEMSRLEARYARSVDRVPEAALGGALPSVVAPTGDDADDYYMAHYGYEEIGGHLYSRTPVMERKEDGQEKDELVEGGNEVSLGDTSSSPTNGWTASSGHRRQAPGNVKVGVAGDGKTLSLPLVVKRPEVQLSLESRGPEIAVAAPAIGADAPAVKAHPEDPTRKNLDLKIGPEEGVEAPESDAQTDDDEDTLSQSPDLSQSSADGSGGEAEYPSLQDAFRKRMRKFERKSQARLRSVDESRVERLERQAREEEEARRAQRRADAKARRRRRQQAAAAEERRLAAEVRRRELAKEKAERKSRKHNTDRRPAKRSDQAFFFPVQASTDNIVRSSNY